MIFFCVVISAKKNCYLILGVVQNDPLFVQIALTKQFWRSFTNFFSELLDCNTSY